MNERDEPMKGLADYLRASASIAERDYPTAANSGTTLRRWAAEVEASRQRSAVGAEPVARVISSGPDANLPLLEWISANTSLSTPIGALLYVTPPSERPAAPAQAERASMEDFEVNEITGSVNGQLQDYSRLAPAQAGVTEALRELLEAMDAPFPPAEEGKDAQTKWAERRCDARAAAYCLLAGTPPAQSDTARPFGCLLAMRVLQSDLYKQLQDDERAQCDELVQRNLEWFKRDSARNAGEQKDGGTSNA